MLRIDKRTLAILLGSAALFLISGLMHLYSPANYVTNLLFPYLSPLIYITLLFVWITFVSQRIIDHDVRGFLVASAVLMLLFIVARLAKYECFEGPDVVLRALWYCYYIPMILLPLLTFMAALHVGRDGVDRPSKWWNLLFVPALIFVVVVLTNDLHQLVFELPLGIIGWRDNYSYGPLYFVITAWEVILLGAAFLFIIGKCRISLCRSRAWIPFIPLFICGLYLLWYAYGGQFEPIRKIFELAEMYCFMIVGFWEGCIQIGLIPSNSRYRMFFANSSIAGQIARGDQRVIYRSKTILPATSQQMRDAREQPIFLNSDLRFSSVPVSGGDFFWLEDLHAMHAINTQLEEVRARLAEENDLLVAENDLKEQLTSADEQNRLYSEMATLVKPQIVAISTLLDHAQDCVQKAAQGEAAHEATVDGWQLPQEESALCSLRNSLASACVRGAYVKRRCNLALLAQGQQELAVAEVEHCILESMEYLEIQGTSCCFAGGSRSSIAAKDALFLYDVFERMIEAIAPRQSALYMNLFERDNMLELLFSLDGDLDYDALTTLAFTPCPARSTITVDIEDDTVFVRMSVMARGDGEA